MKYIPTLDTNNNIQEKINYLKDQKDFNPVNTSWLLENVEKLAMLISNTRCSGCDKHVGKNWYAIKNSIVCHDCFIMYRDNL